MGATDHGLGERLPAPPGRQRATEPAHEVHLLEFRPREGPGMEAEIGQQPPPRPPAERTREVDAVQMRLARAEERVRGGHVGPGGVGLRPGTSAWRRRRPRQVGREQDEDERPDRVLQSFWIMTWVAVTVAAVVLQLVRLPLTCTFAPGLRLALQSLVPLPPPLHL